MALCLSLRAPLLDQDIRGGSNILHSSPKWMTYSLELMSPLPGVACSSGSAGCGPSVITAIFVSNCLAESRFNKLYLASTAFSILRKFMFGQVSSPLYS